MEGVLVGMHLVAGDYRERSTLYEWLTDVTVVPQTSAAPQPSAGPGSRRPRKYMKAGQKKNYDKCHLPGGVKKPNKKKRNRCSPRRHTMFCMHCMNNSEHVVNSCATESRIVPVPKHKQFAHIADPSHRQRVAEARLASHHQRLLLDPGVSHSVTAIREAQRKAKQMATRYGLKGNLCLLETSLLDVAYCHSHGVTIPARIGDWLLDQRPVALPANWVSRMNSGIGQLRQIVNRVDNGLCDRADSENPDLIDPVPKRSRTGSPIQTATWRLCFERAVAASSALHWSINERCVAGGEWPVQWPNWQSEAVNYLGDPIPVPQRHCNSMLSTAAAGKLGADELGK